MVSMPGKLQHFGDDVFSVHPGCPSLVNNLAFGAVQKGLISGPDTDLMGVTIPLAW